MTAFHPDEEQDDLPERIIVVREPVSAVPGGLEALAAEVAEVADDGAVDADPDWPMPAIELDAPDDPAPIEAELEALVAEVAAVEDPPSAPAIDLDEVDLRAEHEPLEAIELDDDGEDLDALATEVASEQVELDLEHDRQVLDALATELAARRTPAEVDDGLPIASTSELSPPEGGQLRTGRWQEDETGPSTLRPKVPEPVIAARTIAPPSRSRRMLRRLRALVGLIIVVVLAGVGLAIAIGAAVLLVVLALSRAFGSGP